LRPLCRLGPNWGLKIEYKVPPSLLSISATAVDSVSVGDTDDNIAVSSGSSSSNMSSADPVTVSASELFTPSEKRRLRPTAVENSDVELDEDDTSGVATQVTGLLRRYHP